MSKLLAHVALFIVFAAVPFSVNAAVHDEGGGTSPQTTSNGWALTRGSVNNVFTTDNAMTSVIDGRLFAPINFTAHGDVALFDDVSSGAMQYEAHWDMDFVQSTVNRYQCQLYCIAADCF